MLDLPDISKVSTKRDIKKPMARIIILTPEILATANIGNGSDGRY